MFCLLTNISPPSFQTPPCYQHPKPGEGPSSIPPPSSHPTTRHLSYLPSVVLHAAERSFQASIRSSSRGSEALVTRSEKPLKASPWSPPECHSHVTPSRWIMRWRMREWGSKDLPKTCPGGRSPTNRWGSTRRYSSSGARLGPPLPRELRATLVCIFSAFGVRGCRAQVLWHERRLECCLQRIQEDQREGPGSLEEMDDQ